MVAWQKNINAIGILAIVIVLSGAFSVQVIFKEVPCPLCMLQRLCMIGVATSLGLNILFGMQMSHYGMALLSSLAGGSVALRQISLHVCPGFPEYGMPVLGLSLYTWSFFVFTCSVSGVALLMFLYRPQDSSEPQSPNLFCKTVLGLLFLVVLGNVVNAFIQCGFGPCSE